MEYPSIGDDPGAAITGPDKLRTKTRGEDQDDRRQRPGGIRMPPILMVLVGIAVGWMVAQWSGAVFGGILGMFLWRSRQ
jgi:hypothetical protein